jgi:tRNA threonylcarbamoyladenosine biosynthesis protein TsaE
MSQTFTIRSLTELEAFANKLAPHLSLGMVITFSGQLGAGKTTLIQRIAKALGIRATLVSPTFTIMKVYPMPQGQLVHIDAYRLQGRSEDIGIEEQANSESLMMIEWPERLANIPHGKHLAITLTIVDETTRLITVEGLNQLTL